MNEGMGAESTSIYMILTAMVDQMAAVAWAKLGLQPDPVTGKIVADYEEAKVAIDITTHLASFIEPKLDEDDKRQLHTLIRDLRLNYVQRTKEGTA